MNDFHGLYERYAKPLYRFAVALSGNTAEAEDLVADAFVRLWTTPGEIREATIQAYLFTIVRNLFLTKRRRASRQVPLEDSIAEDATPIDQRTAAASELARVRQMLRTLADLDRAALLMRGQQGRSYEDIGAALGLSAGAARVRVHRARLQLAKAIGRSQ